MPVVTITAISVLCVLVLAFCITVALKPFFPTRPPSQPSYARLTVP